MFFKRTVCALLLIAAIHMAGQVEIHAQLLELEIRPMEAPSEGAVVFLDHPGRVVVTIRSSLTSLNFSSNMEILDQRNDPAAGEYRIVIRPENQILTVNAPGYMSQGIQLRGLQPNDRFYYSVEPTTTESGNTLPVVIRVAPSTAANLAVALIDGERADISSTIELEPGSYQIDIRADGFRSLSEIIDVGRQQVFFEFSLQELQEQVVRIKTEPAGAMVFLDGIEQGNTDRTGTLELFRLPGSYEISIFLSGHQNVQETIEVDEESSNEFSFDLERNTAQLVLNVEPENALVRVNQQLVEVPGSMELSAGTHRLEASLEGYESYSEIIGAERGQQIERTIRLQAHTGGLQFRVNPSFAEAELRDSNNQQIDRWTGIHRIDQVKTGTYILRVMADGYQSQEQEIEILKDEVKQTTIRLEQVPVRDVVTNTPEIQPQERPVLEPSLPLRNTALTASLLMPGSGHIYSGQNRGYLYLLGGLAAGGYAVYTLMEEGNIESDYNEALRNYNSAGSFSDATRYSNEAIQHYNDWNDLIDRRTIALAAFAGIYAIQLVDILISTPERGYRDSPRSGWQAGTNGTGVRLRYSFN